LFSAFIEEKLDCPKHLARIVWNNWKEPKHQEFQPRTAYSLQNAYTSAFHQLEPVPCYKATASLATMFA
jgi:hypothetical protein